MSEVILPFCPISKPTVFMLSKVLPRVGAGGEEIHSILVETPARNLVMCSKEGKSAISAFKTRENNMSDGEKNLCQLVLKQANLLHGWG